VSVFGLAVLDFHSAMGVFREETCESASIRQLYETKSRLKAKEKGGQMPVEQLLIYPVHRLHTPKTMIRSRFIRL
jgi:hypothetical protein